MTDQVSKTLVTGLLKNLLLEKNGKNIDIYVKKLNNIVQLLNLQKAFIIQNSNGVECNILNPPELKSFRTEYQKLSALDENEIMNVQPEYKVNNFKRKLYNAYTLISNSVHNDFEYLLQSKPQHR